MANRARWHFGASFLVLSLIIGEAAYAAAENASEEKPSQTEPDSKSYLPPWMQGQGGSEKANASADSAAPAITTTPKRKTAAADNGRIKRRARVQRSYQHAAPADGFVGGFAGLFGR